MTVTKTVRIGEDDAERGYANIQRQQLERQASNTADWTAKEMIAEKDAQVARLQEELETLQKRENVDS